MENINKKDIDLSALIKIGFFLVDDPKVPPLLYAEYLDRRNANRVTNRSEEHTELQSH